MTNLDVITPQLIENLLKDWQMGIFASEDLEKVNALTPNAQPVTEKHLWLRNFLYELALQNLSATCLDLSQSPDPKQVVTALKALFQEKPSDYQIFALIYCRYFNIQQYQVKELANLTNMTTRTLRRYLLKGFSKLSTQIKIELSQKDKIATAFRNHLKDYFPTIETDRIIGIEPHLAQLNHWLDDKDAPRAISIEGLGGIGKTLLAQCLFEQRYQADAHDDYVWVSARQHMLSFRGEINPIENFISNLDDIVMRLAQNLGQDQLTGLNTQDKLAHLKHLCEQKNVLIFIDNLETIEDVEHLVPALLKLSGRSKLIFTSRQSLRQYPSVRAFPIPELSYEDSRALVLGEIKRLGLPFELDDETMRSLYTITGGIPLVLKLATAQFGQIPAKEIIRQLRLGEEHAQNMYTYIYRQAWSLLADAGKKLLISMLLISPDGEDRKWICDMGDLTEKEFNIGVNELKRLSLIEFAGSIDTPRYRIHRLTATFLQTDILRGWETKTT